MQRFQWVRAALLFGTGAALAPPVWSQTAEESGGAEAPGPARSVEEVVVIGTAAGTRISGFDAPTPVTEVNQEQLQAKAITRVSELLTDVPAFAANQNLGRSSAPIGASNFDLRGLGPARTLLLLDGRRVAATDPSGGIDTNVIPATLMKSVEVVTGGASAAYGSDAVSGIVSITLDDEFEGIKGDLQYGVSTYGDVEAPSLSVAGGRAFAGGRGHWVGSLDFYDNSGQLNESSRPWGRAGYALVTNSDGPPTRLRAANARFSQLTDGGVAALRNVPALRGFQFGPNGEVLPFEYGISVGTTYMIGGDGGSLSGQANIFPEITRQSAFTRATYELSDRVRIYADALYSNIDIFSDGTTATNRGDLAIKRDNPFLPQEVLDLMVANDVQTFYMGRIGAEEGAFYNTVDNTVQRYGFGIDGTFGDSWRWDAILQLSSNQYDRMDGNNRNVRRFALGVDAVADPGTGAPVCRALLNDPQSTDPDIANCVPVNVFGAGSVSDDAIRYFGGTAVMNSEQTQTLFAVNLDGRPFRTWAGDVSVALGFEHREDEIDATSDPLSQAGGWITVNPQPLSGDVSVSEAYTEIVIPLMEDQPFGYAMDLNGAVRVTDYSTSGQVTTWKLGANYSPTDNLRFRGTLSEDIRAPSINELYSGQNQSITNLIDPRDNSNPTVVQYTGGNPGLTPETSDAWTAGIVYQPTWADGLKLSFDYFSFKIIDAIASLDGQSIIDGCFIRMQGSLCNAITQGGQGNITHVQATLLNAAEAKSSGFDVEIAYSMPFGNGVADLRLLANYVEELSTTINGVTSDLVGQLGSESAGGIPEWRFVGSARYRTETFAVGMLFRYIDDGTYRAEYVDGVDIDDNYIPSRTYFDVDWSRLVGDHFELYAKINNLFDSEPPLAPNPITSPSYNGGAYHDRIGRYFKLGVRFEF